MGERKRVVAMAPYERPWSNVELVKDCGLIPYLLYKNHNCESVMVGAPGGEYSYLSLVQGLQMEFLEDGRQETKLKYIAGHAKEIDLLILRGFYPDYQNMIPLYKQLNPEGKICLNLDANSIWADRIDCKNELFCSLLQECDVITTSGKMTQRYLNEKWTAKISYIPNGYYAFGEERPRYDFSEKNNTILTVGRLGTQQKATHVMLEAFVRAAEKIPDWKLRLVGSVEPGFEPEIQRYFERNPELRERVVFVGEIHDRQKLFQEYRQAKIFTLSSEVEGGAPNVVAEALNAGCVTAVTRFDGAWDATNFETCGVIAEIDDAEGLAQGYIRLAGAKNLREMSERAYLYGSTCLNMERIVAKLYEQIFGDE